MKARWMRWGVPLGVLGVFAIVLLATGALLPRDDVRTAVLEPGDVVETDRATIEVVGVQAGDDGITATLTVTNHLADPLWLDSLARATDNAGALATFALIDADGTGSASRAQPGVTDTFTYTWSPDRAVEGVARIEVLDARFVPRDETGFGLGATMYDERVVGTVTVP